MIVETVIGGPDFVNARDGAFSDAMSSDTTGMFVASPDGPSLTVTAETSSELVFTLAGGRAALGHRWGIVRGV